MTDKIYFILCYLFLVFMANARIGSIEYFVDLALTTSSDVSLSCLKKINGSNGIRVRMFGYDPLLDIIHVRIYSELSDKRRIRRRRSDVNVEEIINACVHNKTKIEVFEPLIRCKRNGEQSPCVQCGTSPCGHDWNKQNKQNIRSSPLSISDQSKIKFNDPWVKMQWNSAPVSNGGANIIDAWNKGYSGKGVSICIIDDGIDHKHEDLSDRYRADLSYDFNDPDDVYSDPIPSSFDGMNSHGTKCAGVAAAGANNGVCGVGVAFQADIAGHRILDGIVTGVMEGQSLSYKNKDTFIKSLSWGPSDDGKSMERPGILASRALEAGVKSGRHGKGTIFVWASGNGGCFQDHCGADAYVSNQNVIAIGSVNQEGKLPFFTEYCPAVLAVVPSGGLSKNATRFQFPSIGCVTTDVMNKCSVDFIGTSAAAPLASGIMALALEANQNLTYRDVMHIITQTSKVPNHVADASWKLNNAGFLVSDRFGFGVMDASAIVDVAKDWKLVGPRLFSDSAEILYSKNDSILRPGDTFVSRIALNVDGSEDFNVSFIEHVIA